jgi:hypothetical protein
MANERSLEAKEDRERLINGNDTIFAKLHNETLNSLD